MYRWIYQPHGSYGLVVSEIIDISLSHWNHHPLPWNRDLIWLNHIQCWIYASHTVDGRNPKQPPGMVIKPCKSWEIYHLNWWSPDFSHQQYEMHLQHLVIPCFLASSAASNMHEVSPATAKTSPAGLLVDVLDMDESWRRRYINTYSPPQKKTHVPWKASISFEGQFHLPTVKFLGDIC